MENSQQTDWQIYYARSRHHSTILSNNKHLQSCNFAKKPRTDLPTYLPGTYGGDGHTRRREPVAVARILPARRRRRSLAATRIQSRGDNGARLRRPTPRAAEVARGPHVRVRRAAVAGGHDAGEAHVAIPARTATRRANVGTRMPPFLSFSPLSFVSFAQHIHTYTHVLMFMFLFLFPFLFIFL